MDASVVLLKLHLHTLIPEDIIVIGIGVIVLVLA